MDEFRFGLGESFLTADGFVEGLDRTDSLRYRASLLNLVLRRQDVETLAGSLPQPHYQLLENLRADGTL
ncbi:MAG: hypothetical protein U5K31_03575, partial [Balneolaceae bacterium]|nr:hypothetical protein [Balneolaceae bacterium]